MDIFGKHVKKDQCTPEEWELRMMFLQELLVLTSKGGCPDCTRARLLAKYKKKHHGLQEAKRRADQGTEVP